VGAEPIVLIVDDDASVREALQRLLSREGIGAIGARSLGEARERIALHATALRIAIIDLELGQEDGLDLVRELKRSTSPLSILVFSAAADGGARAQSLALEGEVVLAKPASPQAILTAVRRTLGDVYPGVIGERMRTHPSRGSHWTS
jgi:two-component system, NtrC family, response regulator AtoC